MPFANQILGGQSTLVRPAIKSPNFAHGSAGWSINKDGSAEFNSATIRGTVTAGEFVGTDFIINQSGAFFYNGTPAHGNMVASIASVTGTDQFGNVYGAGVNVYAPGTNAQISISSDTISLFSLSGVQLTLMAEDIGGNTYYSFTGAAFLEGAGGWSALNPVTGIGPETWHPVSISGGPSGSSGTARVKMSPVANFAIVDIEISFPALGAQSTFTIGSLIAAYYPATARHYAAGIAGTATGTPQPRLLIPTSGGLVLGNVPAGATSFGCTVSYPLD